MKKVVTLSLCFSLLTVLTACSSSSSSSSQPTSNNTAISDNSTDSTSQTDSTDPYTYNISSVNSLNGLFRLDAPKEYLWNITDRLNIDGLHAYDSEDFVGHICESKEVPVTINQTDGEKLVLVGGEYNGSDKIKVYPASFIGYSNISDFYRISLSDMIEFQGIDVSDILDDPAAINNSLSGTGISYHKYEDNQSNKWFELILADKEGQTINYSAYYGTQSKTQSVEMTHSCFIVKDDAGAYVPIQKTQDGYFIIDTSTLSPGIYTVDSSSGWYAINLE